MKIKPIEIKYKDKKIVKMKKEEDKVFNDVLSSFGIPEKFLENRQKTADADIDFKKINK